MDLWQTYHLPQSLNEAVQLLADYSDSAKIAAGGTDLLLEMRQGRHPLIKHLVDVTSIPELNQIEIQSDQLIIGAGVALSQILANSGVQQHATALYEACRLIGGPQVRNVATLGGNVAHALPAADGAIALFALEAQAELAGQDGCRLISMEQLYLSPGRNNLLPGELIVSFHIPIEHNSGGSAFRRVMRPQGVAIAIQNLAIWLKRMGDHILDIRLAIGPAGQIPRRLRSAEQVLRGQEFQPALLDEAEKAVLAECKFRTSPHRASADYRRQLVRPLLDETWTAAWSRGLQS